MEQTVEIYRGSGGPARAELLRSVLEGSGIECFVRPVGGTGGYPVNVGGLGEFALVIHERDAERARELLLDLEE